jgi:hypothetical protein
MIKLASRLGWLAPEEERAEFVRIFNQRLASNAVNPADVYLACTLNDDHELDQELGKLQKSSVPTGAVARSAILACLGDTEARAQVLSALTGPDTAAAQIAQAYLRSRPISNVDELRELTSKIVHSDDSVVQVRALDALAGQQLADPESIEMLARLFPVAQSAEVQAAIAGILIRSDYQAIATLEFAQTVRESSLTSAGRSGPVDILLRRMSGS